MIRIPVHVVEKLNKIGRAERKLVTEFGREPAAEEIAEVAGIELEEIESIKRFAQAPVSLEQPVEDEEESEFGQLIADERAESPYEHAAEIPSPTKRCETRWRSSAIASVACSSCATGSVASVRGRWTRSGRTFNVTRERIRQIESQSLKKLQSLAEAQKLRATPDRFPRRASQISGVTPRSSSR